MRVKKIIAVTLAVAMAVTMFPVNGKKAEAVNPIVQDLYTADPAPMVCSDGRLYLYSSHDEDITLNGFFSMNDWYCYSTDDMVNWQEHGRVLGYQEFEWAKENSAWAPQCVERDGMFYMYVPLNAKNGQTAIGVAVADNPLGPFEDALGEPLVGPAPNYIDPTVWIDDDGQAYLYWGNPDLFCVVLNDDMISYDKSYGDNGIIKWDLETNDFSDLEGEDCQNMQAQFGVGTRMDNGKLRRPTLYEEGPWFYKRGDYYYLIYAANGIPERIDYSMATNPLGPWEYKGMIMDDKDADGKGTGSFTNHPGIVDYKGHSYLFYHTGRLYDGGGYHRSVAIEEITYNDDGTINEVDITKEGVDPIKAFNPYAIVEAETIEYSNSLKAADTDPLGKFGIEKEKKDIGQLWLTAIENEDYICIRNVDFTDYGAVKFSATTSAATGKDVSAGKIELYLDDMYGECLGEIDVKGGETEDEWVTATIDIDKTKAKGIHDLYMVFTGEEGKENLFKFDKWEFTQDYVPTPTPVPTVAPTPTSAPVVTAPTPTPVPEVKAPAKVKNLKALAAKKKVTLKWKKLSKVAGYEVKIALNKKFKKGLNTAVTKKNKITIKKLKSKKTYYLKVCAFNKKADGTKVKGKYSSVVKVRVK